MTSSVTNPAEMKAGDIFQVVYQASQQETIDLQGMPAGSEFDMAVINLSNTGGAAGLQISNDLAEPMFAEEEESDAEVYDLSLQEAFDDRMRGVELALSAERSVALAKSASGGTTNTTEPPAVGTTEVFHEMASVAKSGSTVDVTGRVACVTDALIFYVDVEVERRNTDDLTSADVATLCRNFQVAFARERALFGEPSDVNGDGHVAILLTPQVNRLGSTGGGIITGFFYANDLSQGRSTNGREMLHVMVPDSKGLYGTPIAKDFALRNLIPAVLPHEMQHAISYNQHVLERHGRPEESWLNEGLSHLAEDILGYGIENPSRYAIFLARPEAYGLVTPASPGLAARGGIFLFLRYLYEQQGDKALFLRRLLDTDATGVANVEAAFASTDRGFDQFAEFLLRWSAAVALNNRNISNDPRFGYAAPARALTGYWEGVCTVCSPDDNRGTLLAGVKLNAYSGMTGLTLAPAATQFYHLATPPKQLHLWAPEQGSFGMVLIRTK